MAAEFAESAWFWKPACGSLILGTKFTIHHVDEGRVRLAALRQQFADEQGIVDHADPRQTSEIVLDHSWRVRGGGVRNARRKGGAMSEERIRDFYELFGERLPSASTKSRWTGMGPKSPLGQKRRRTTATTSCGSSTPAAT